MPNEPNHTLTGLCTCGESFLTPWPSPMMASLRHPALNLDFSMMRNYNVFWIVGFSQRGGDFCPNDKLEDVWQHSLLVFAEYIGSLWHLRSKTKCDKIIMIEFILMKVCMYVYLLIYLFFPFQGWPSCTQGVHHVETKPCSRSVGSFHAAYLCGRYRSVHGISQFHISPPSSESHWG